MRWHLLRIQVPTMAGKGIWDCTNGTRNSLPTGIFLSWYFQTPELLPVGCTGRRRRRRQKSFSGMDSCRDGTEGIPTCWTSQPSVFKQFSVNCSFRAKLSHSPSQALLDITSCPLTPALPSPMSVPVRHFVLPYHKEDAGRRAYITYMCIFKLCLHPASKRV